MKKIIMITILITASAFAWTIAPDGSYHSGTTTTIAPDGTYVSGSTFEITPNGSYVGVN